MPKETLITPGPWIAEGWPRSSFEEGDAPFRRWVVRGPGMISMTFFCRDVEGQEFKNAADKVAALLNRAHAAGIK